MNWLPLLALLAASPPLPAEEGGTVAPGPRAVRPTPALVREGIPATPPALARRLLPWQSVRGASFVGWGRPGEGLLIATRFGANVQVHAVREPGATREQRTFSAAPVTRAVVDPGSGDLVFVSDPAGGERFRIRRLPHGGGEPVPVGEADEGGAGVGGGRSDAVRMATGGGRIAFRTTARNGVDFDVRVLDLRTGKGRTLVEGTGDWTPLDWSPDDRWLLVRHTVSASASTLHLVEVATGARRAIQPDAPAAARPAAAFARGRPAGSGPPAVFFASDQTGEFARLYRWDPETGDARAIGPEPTGDVTGLAASDDGRWLAWIVNERGASAVHVAAVRRPEKAKRVPLPLGVGGPPAFEPGSRSFAFTWSTPRGADVWSVDAKSRRATRWTTSEIGGLPADTFVEPVAVRFPASDGKPVHGWFYAPRPRGGGGPAPVVISLHGGPEGQAGPSFQPMLQYLARELGYAVLVPNVRGSGGHGRTWRGLDDGALRGDAVEDVAAALAWVASRPELDASRIALHGTSYGGWLALESAARHPDRVRCVAEVSGMTDLAGFLAGTDAYRRDRRREEYGDERKEEVRAALAALSPLAHPEALRMPLFLAHGGRDPRVPVGEVRRLATAVRANGGTVWLMIAPDEGHGFTRKRTRDAWLEAMTLFLEENLGAAP